MKSHIKIVHPTSLFCKISTLLFWSSKSNPTLSRTSKNLGPYKKVTKRLMICSTYGKTQVQVKSYLKIMNLMSQPLDKHLVQITMKMFSHCQLPRGLTLQVLILPLHQHPVEMIMKMFQPPHDQLTRGLALS